MTEGAQTSLDALDLLVGEWRMATTFTPEAAESPRARARFEWLPGRRFLIQRWEVEHPEAPDGIASGCSFEIDERGVLVYDPRLPDGGQSTARRTRRVLDLDRPARIRIGRTSVKR